MQQLPKRLLSIDVLRAVTMLLMIFVNDASGIKNIPEWIGHTAANVDGMGFADTIFPAFLFIVGLSLPFAINNKIKKGESTGKILLYILTRSIALLVIGFFHVNMDHYPSDDILPQAVWGIIITLAFFLIWLDYPDTLSKAKKYTLVGTGVLLLIAMAFIHGDMKPSWWGILGIIGWTYLVCAIIYLFTKGDLKLLLPLLIVFVVVNIASHTGLITKRLWIVADCSSVTLTMSGIVISRLYAYLVERGKTQLLWLILAISGLALIFAGLLIRPYAGGISKIHSTPAWVFICTGITILVFEASVYLIDIKHNESVFRIIRPAGTSTLTCYLMPYFLFFTLDLLHVHFPLFLREGIGGLLRAIIISFILIWIVGLMEKKSLRLKI